MLPAPGTYRARAGGPLKVNEAKTGSLCVYIPVLIEIDAGEQNGWTWNGMFTMTLIKGSDGTAMIDNIKTCCEVFGWDGNDPTWLQQEEDGTPRDLTAKEFNVVGEHEEFTPEGADAARTAFKIKWLNPLNRSIKMPEMGDAKMLRAKYGNKFRALAASATAPKKEVAAETKETKKEEVKKETKTPPSPPAKKPAQTAGGQPVTSTMEEAWGALVAANPGKADDALGDVFWATVGELFPGKQNSDLSIQDWGQVKVKVSS